MCQLVRHSSSSTVDTAALVIGSLEAVAIVVIVVIDAHTCEPRPPPPSTQGFYANFILFAQAVGRRIIAMTAIVAVTVVVMIGIDAIHTKGRKHSADS